MIDTSNPLVIDVETNALRNPTQIHVVCTRDIDGNTREFINPLKNSIVMHRMLSYMRGFSCYVGHHLIGYDYAQVFNKIVPDHPLTLSNMVDTLVLSRLFKFTNPPGHSIEAWGNRLGVKKQGTGIEQWDTLTPDMISRCHSDTDICLRIYQRYAKYIKKEQWQRSIDLEQRMAFVCSDMSDNGFGFDVTAAKELLDRVTKVYEPVSESIATQFKPRVVPIREVTPRCTKAGTFNMNDFRWYDGDDLTMFTGDPFTIVAFEDFNPGSPMQVIDRLNEAGWKPTDKTKGHIEILRQRKKDPEKLERFKKYGWKISEENLETLPDTAPPAAHDIVKWLTLRNRIGSINEWLNLAEDTPEGPVVHGSFMPIGAWTHRLSHSAPNLANIPVAKRSKNDNEFRQFINDVNDDMRGLWVARKGKKLIGTDAAGIQMCIFAHYVDDPVLTTAITQGDKSKGTDIHTLHMNKLGRVCKSRDVAKTFIYAWLLGAGTAKIAEILDTNMAGAKQAVENFITSYPGLLDLKKNKIPEDASRGYFEGLDGRLVMCDSEHHMLAGYLQNGEAVVMKTATLLWQQRLRDEGIPFRLVTLPHDEWQTEVPDDDDVVRFVQDVQVQSIRDTTDILNLRCPMDGESSSGYSWKDTH